MRFLLTFLACFALISAAQAATDNVAIDASWRITIDPQGHVTTMTAASTERIDHIPQIRTRLEQAVRNWQFLPGLVDGKPAETQTRLHLSITLIPTSDNSLQIKVDRANLGGELVSQIAPRYPAEAIRHQQQGEVVLRVAYDTTGKVTSATIFPGSPVAAPLLVDASVNIARKWQFTPEIVGGHGVAGEVVTPFCYSLGRHRGTHCDWKRPGDSDALRDGETLALNPAAKLLTEVAGHTL